MSFRREFEIILRNFHLFGFNKFDGSKQRVRIRFSVRCRTVVIGRFRKRKRFLSFGPHRFTRIEQKRKTGSESRTVIDRQTEI